MKRENLFLISAALTVACSLSLMAAPAYAIEAPPDTPQMIVVEDLSVRADRPVQFAFRDDAVDVLDTHKISRVDFSDAITLRSADVAATRVPQYPPSRELTAASLQLNAAAGGDGLYQAATVTKIRHLRSGAIHRATTT